MQTVIQKIGNSKGMIIPKKVLDSYSLNERDVVELIETEQGIIIKPVEKERTKRRSIQALFEQYPEPIQEKELVWGEPVGDEVW